MSVSAIQPRAAHRGTGAALSDEDLVQAARRGEAWAQHALFLRHARFLNGLSYRLMAGHPDYEDIAQDTFVTAFDRLDTLEKPGMFRGWLAGIAVRQANKRIRRQRLLVRLGLMRREAIDLDSLVGNRNPPPDVEAELRSVYRAVERLPSEARIALVLRRVQGYELTEIADAMGLSLSTVKRRLQLADAFVRDLVENGGEHHE